MTESRLDRLLARARSRLSRLEPLEAQDAVHGGALLIDTRPECQRRMDGEISVEAGSRQQDLWGANYYPGRGRDGCIEFTALINISPALGNRSMEVGDPAIRERIRALAFGLLGEGGAL